jgi:ComF family protein
MVAMARTDFHLRRDNMLEQVFWGRCRVERATAFSVYNRGSRIRKLIHSLKYGGRKEIGRMLGELYGSTLAESGFMNGIDYIVPVPLSAERERKRGFNQSECFAQGLSVSTRVPVRTDIIKRTGESESQTRRGRYERWENVEGIFTVRKHSLIAGKHLLVADDVITTGSTMEACVNALQAYGDVKVSVVAMAAAQKLTL